jgi:hypothetical protein
MAWSQGLDPPLAEGFFFQGISGNLPGSFTGSNLGLANCSSGSLGAAGSVDLACWASLRQEAMRA